MAGVSAGDIHEKVEMDALDDVSQLATT